MGTGESSVSGFWKEAGAACSWTLFRAGTGKQSDVIPNRLHPGTRESHHLPLLRNCRLPSSRIYIISLASGWTMVSTSSKHDVTAVWSTTCSKSRSYWSVQIQDSLEGFGVLGLEQEVEFLVKMRLEKSPWETPIPAGSFPLPQQRKGRQIAVPLVLSEHFQRERLPVVEATALNGQMLNSQDWAC